MSAPSRSVLVLGGSKGIGGATAIRLAEPGGLVVVNGHQDVEAAGRTADRVRARGAECLVVMGDVSTPEGVEDVVGRVAERTDRVDVLVHSAVLARTGPLMALPIEEVELALRTGGMSLLYAARACDRLLGAGSSIFFVSSLGSQRAVPDYGPIGVAKAAAEALVRYLAVELAPRGIRVNTVSSGPVDTDAYRSAFPDADERLARAAHASPAHRPQTPEDVAELISLLASPGAELVQGQHVRVDGGLYLR